MLKKFFHKQSLFRQLLFSYLAVIVALILCIGSFIIFAMRANFVDNLEHYLKIEAVAINSYLESNKHINVSDNLKVMAERNPAFWIIVYDKNNKLIESSIGRHKFINLPERFYKESQSVLKHGKIVTYKHYMPLSEVKWYFFSRPYIDKYSLKVKGVIQVGLPLENINKGILDSIYLLIFIVILISGLTALLIYSLSKQLSEPVNNISKQAQYISSTGDLDVEVSVNHSNKHNEIGELAVSFNKMIKELKEKRQFQKEFIANASHELKTPVMAINSAVEVINNIKNIKDLNDKSGLKDFINIIERQSYRAGELIEALLDISLLDSGKLTIEKSQCNLNNLIESCVQDSLVLAQDKSIDLSWYSSKKYIIQASEQKLHRVFNNLIVNAIKYSPENTEIFIEIKESNTNVLVEVHDNGYGITPEDQDKIFDRFFRPDSARTREAGGSGLGLAIAKQIIELHQGEISVQSEINKGSTFTVKLPYK